MIAAAVAIKYGQGRGLLSPSDAQRFMQVIIGLALAVYANFIPKNVEASRSTLRSHRYLSTLRFGGWAFTIAGLGYAGLWGIAPERVASAASMALVGGAVVCVLVRLAFCLGGADGATSRATG